MVFHQGKKLSHTSFFDLSRAATVRENPSIRLRRAAIDGNIAAVKRLSKHVVNIQNPDPDNGYTTLMYAAENGHTELVNVLLEMGHEEEAISVDNKGTSVLMIAALHNHEEIFYDYVSRYPECIHAISRNGLTALLYAAQTGNTGLVDYLLSISADIDHTDYDGNSALHYASAWGHYAVMELLMSQGCNLDLENMNHFNAADYAYSFAVQEHLKGLSTMQFNDDSSLSLSSLRPGRPYPSSLSSSVHPSFNTIAMAHASSLSGYEPPTPRASTSSSSIPVPMANSLPVVGSSSPRGSNFHMSGSPSSFSDIERHRAASFGEHSRSPKGRY